MTCAEETQLLADGEHHLDGRVGQAVLAAGTQALEHDRHAGLVVAAQHGAAVAADDVALDHR